MKSNLFSSVFLVLLVGVLFVYEVNLGTHRAIYLWDEATYANNSLEMVQHKNYLVYTVNDVVDHHNSKPPLVLWLQVLGYALFGYNEFAVRFPSYLALAATLLACLYYSRRLTGDTRAGALAGLALLLGHGTMRCHVFLSGDLDGLLVCFTAFITFHHLKVIRQGAASNRDIYTYLLFFLLAYLTKSTAILLILPSLFISLLLNRQLKNVLWRRATLWSAIAFVVLVAGYYFIREQYDPGYWQVVWFSEFTRLTVNVQPWFHYPWNVYFLFIWERFFRHPLMLLAVAGPIYLVLPAAKHKKLFLHALVLALTYLFTITIPPVKMEWYDAPMYPMIAFAIGIAVTQVIDVVLIKVRSSFVKDLCLLVVTCGLLAWAFIPFRERLLREIGTYQQQEESANALQVLAGKYPQVKQFRVLESIGDIPRFGHIWDAIRYYRHTLKLNHQTNVTIHDNVHEFKPGDTVLTCQQENIRQLEKHTMALDSCRSCKWLKID